MTYTGNSTAGNPVKIGGPGMTGYITCQAFITLILSLFCIHASLRVLNLELDIKYIAITLR